MAGEDILAISLAIRRRASRWAYLSCFRGCWAVSLEIDTVNGFSQWESENESISSLLLLYFKSNCPEL